MAAADLEFFFDPVCPFCWNTARWVRLVRDIRGIDVEWRFISLAQLNEGEYDDKPEGYPEAHQRGLEMLRVAAAVRDEHGEEAVGPLYRRMGEAVWHQPPPERAEFEAILQHTGRAGDLEKILADVGLPTDLADAADDPGWDGAIRADTEEALERVGGDVGTPILSFEPPEGPAFFGPVISDVPDTEGAVELWEAVETLARWPGFSELKRSLRHFPSTPLTEKLAGQETRAS